ncbi:MAG: hypothetical protein KF708_15885 [Pirellulales bacterium]|nr:hypothetical protein [Pirellulales bacterium]
MLQFLLLLVVAFVCGSIAQGLVGYSHGGCLVSIALGFIGALLGSWLAGMAGLPDLITIDVDGKQFPVIWSIIGGALFVAVLSVFRRGAPRA